MGGLLYKISFFFKNAIPAGRKSCQLYSLIGIPLLFPLDMPWMQQDEPDLPPSSFLVTGFSRRYDPADNEEVTTAGRSAPLSWYTHKRKEHCRYLV